MLVNGLALTFAIIVFVIILLLVVATLVTGQMSFGLGIVGFAVLDMILLINSFKDEPYSYAQ
jgi:hypothetical protein